jgi:hypothetical protein
MKTSIYFYCGKIFNHQNDNMTTKATNLIYWVSTFIFAGLMAFSAVGGLQPSRPAIQLIHDTLGFPVYFIQFISIAKLIGCLVILIPGINRSIKDWAYAGLFFDLTGAIYSGIAMSGKFDPMMLTMLIWIVPGIVSYYFWHKKMKAESPLVRS